jgi:Arc/MetJ family transcription regulator
VARCSLRGVDGLWRSLVSALRSGRRGPRFKSGQPDSNPLVRESDSRASQTPGPFWRGTFPARFRQDPFRLRTDHPVYTVDTCIYTDTMSKRLIDVDEAALEAARARLGTGTIKETVNESLRLAGDQHQEEVTRALDALARARLSDRSESWR